MTQTNDITEALRQLHEDRDRCVRRGAEALLDFDINNMDSVLYVDPILKTWLVDSATEDLKSNSNVLLAHVVAEANRLLHDKENGKDVKPDEYLHSAIMRMIAERQSYLSREWELVEEVLSDKHDHISTHIVAGNTDADPVIRWIDLRDGDNESFAHISIDKISRIDDDFDDEEDDIPFVFDPCFVIHEWDVVDEDFFDDDVIPSPLCDSFMQCTIESLCDMGEPGMLADQILDTVGEIIDNHLNDSDDD